MTQIQTHPSPSVGIRMDPVLFAVAIGAGTNTFFTFVILQTLRRVEGTLERMEELQSRMEGTLDWIEARLHYTQNKVETNLEVLERCVVIVNRIDSVYLGREACLPGHVPAIEDRAPR